ncbi:tetratricopeptide repeat protein [Nocardia farcinica]|uniref:tetratricopeptide repeat protein n=2 Tax=Nocardiaceae TaxID=85025 RepID=UPI0018962868|nr:tetratricopeptide repeat protein [Nocardia farcinica]MBF6422261.1 tetratricopeptide repeat protein [Nocardia farcinica]MBF6433917.1 tetratricopeptide repeat protein [Nocardia farcinica]MBF6504985.1 tetratricopeptide repeat protein [Nocardia farcinica]
MRALLIEVPPAVTKVEDWEMLYSRVLSESGRSEADAPQERRAAVRPVPRQLPPGVRDFVGRDEQLALLDELLVRADGTGVAIAVITGRPGIGKTALAVRWAGLRSGSFSDGILYADLRGWSVGGPVRPEAVLPGWLRALGVDPATVPDDVESRSALLRTLLDERRILVVLDNVRDEGQARPLLPAAKSCAALLTSRQVLTGMAVHYGAEIIDVPHLSDHESLRLLRNSLGAQVHAEESTSTLISLCAGLPLTLRIVAQTLKERPALPVSSLVTELGDDSRRLDVLETDDPGSDPRTIVSWSHHQLREDVATTFGALGMIPGAGIHIDAVAAVAGVDRVTAARHLRALDRAHLVTLTDSRRVELHDLVHRYAAELSGNSSGMSADAALERLFDYYLHTTRRADELLEPLRYRIELSATSVEATPLHTFEEALSWLDAERATMVALCELDRPALDSARWQLAFLLRAYFFRTLRLFEWVSSHEQAVRAAVRSGDRLGEAMSRANLGVAWHRKGDDEAAMAQYRIARGLFEEQGDIRGFASTLAHEAAVCRRRGEFAEAIRLDSAALETYVDVGARRNVAITLRGLGISESAVEQWDRAAEHLEQSRSIARELRMHMDAARAANSLGWLHIRAGKAVLAEAAFLDAMDSDSRSGGRYETAMALHGLGTVAESQGSIAQAEDLWTEAAGILEGMGSLRAEEVRADLARLSEEGARTTRVD